MCAYPNSILVFTRSSTSSLYDRLFSFLSFFYRRFFYPSACTEASLAAEESDELGEAVMVMVVAAETEAEAEAEEEAQRNLGREAGGREVGFA